MKNVVRASVIMIAILASLPLVAQTAAGGTESAPSRLAKFEFAVSYAPKFIKIADTAGPWQVMSGAAADAVYDLGKHVKHLGLAADVDFEYAPSIKPGVNLRQFSLVAGPRYTLKNKAGVTFYSEALFGFVHASDSVFPTGSTVSSSASSFAMQFGSGLNLPVTKHLGWRVVEADYIGTKLPNNGDNYQGDWRFSTGITGHF